MVKADLFYELSPAADQDIEDIFNYTEEELGLDQAITYVSAFDNIFTNILDNPKLGRKRTEIRPSLRSLTKDNHVVFYRAMKDRIRIVRVLHGSRDLPKFFN